jgi:acetylornithine deacetylase/succinyl-diaminopimelate desuccinylase-like protein
VSRSVNAALAFARAQRPRFVTELKELVRIPSVSGDPRRAADVARCAERLARELRRIGVADVEVVPTARHPVVVGNTRAGAGAPRVLVYGHYDVQPPGPGTPWKTRPFEPARLGDNLYGRGSCDDKGQLLAHVKALEAYMRTVGRPPVNIAFLFEGEEEIGSPNLQDVLKRHCPRLRADVAVMSDTRMLGPTRPAITYALRGALSLELEVRGPPANLHSGNFGGAVHNPIQILCELLGRLHDSTGRVAVPGFYERVRRVDAGERERMRRDGPTDDEIARAASVQKAWGEPGFTLYERTTIRPALIVNGIKGGYQGPGGKAIIPAIASAKLQARLVPDQDPTEIDRLLRAWFARHAPPTARCIIRSAPGSRAAVVDRRHPAMDAATEAYFHAFATSPRFIRSGGTIPFVSLAQELFGIPTVMMGFALPTSRIHAPNEHFHLPTFARGIDTCIRFYDALARNHSPQIRETTSHRLRQPR